MTNNFTELQIPQPVAPNEEQPDGLTQKFLDFFEKRQGKPEPKPIDDIDLPQPLGIDAIEKMQLRAAPQFSGKKFDADIICQYNKMPVIKPIIGCVIGIIIVVLGYFIILDNIFSQILVITIGFAFAWMLGIKLTLLNQEIVIKKHGIAMNDLGAGKFIAWQGIKKVKLRYASGHYHCEIADDFQKMQIDGALKKFNLVIACTAQAIRITRTPLDELTLANFAMMGHLFSHMDFSNDELEDLRTKRGGIIRKKSNNQAPNTANSSAKPDEVNDDDDLGENV